MARLTPSSCGRPSPPCPALWLAPVLPGVPCSLVLFTPLLVWVQFSSSVSSFPEGGGQASISVFSFYISELTLSPIFTSICLRVLNSDWVVFGFGFLSFIVDFWGEPLSTKKTPQPVLAASSVLFCRRLCVLFAVAWAPSLCSSPLCGRSSWCQSSSARRFCLLRICSCECLWRVEGDGHVLFLFHSYRSLNFSLLVPTFSSLHCLQEGSPHFFRLTLIDRWHRVSFRHTSWPILV